MENQFVRTELLLGPRAVAHLGQCRVAVFGIGGVGSFAAEALVRSGLGHIALIDNDRVSRSNLNRQLFALHSTLGRYKVDAARERLLDVNPELHVEAYRTFYLPENAGDFDLRRFDYIVDAVDTVSAKLTLALEAQGAGVPLISAMGTGNKLDPAQLRISDISETRNCPLARVMRKECRKRGVRKLLCVWSPEEPIPPHPEAVLEEQPNPGKRRIPGSSALVPPAAGILLAARVIRDLTAGL